MRPDLRRRAGAVAAVVAGLAWMYKASVILATGREPPGAFALGVGLFPLALVGLHAGLAGRGGRAATAALACAALAAVAVVAVAAAAVFAPEALPSSETDVTWATPAVAAAGALPFLSLALLGFDAWRLRAFGRASWLPGATGLAVVPLLAAGAALEPFGWFEAPIVLLGAAWVALGVLAWRATPAEAPAPA